MPYSDPSRGTVRFYVPDSALRPPTVSATAPNAAPVEQPAVKTRERNVYQVDVPIQPGETRFDISYAVPFSSPGVFSGKVLEEEGRVWLVAPLGVSLKGDGLQPPQQDPTTRASIYEVKGREYKVELEAAAAGGGRRTAGRRSIRSCPGSTAVSTPFWDWPSASWPWDSSCSTG